MGEAETEEVDPVAGGAPAAVGRTEGHRSVGPGAAAHHTPAAAAVSGGRRGGVMPTRARAPVLSVDSSRDMRSRGRLPVRAEAVSSLQGTRGTGPPGRKGRSLPAKEAQSARPGVRGRRGRVRVAAGARLPEPRRRDAERISHAVESLTATCLAAGWRGAWMAGRPRLKAGCRPCASPVGSGMPLTVITSANATRRYTS